MPADGKPDSTPAPIPPTPPNVPPADFPTFPGSTVTPPNPPPNDGKP